MRLSGLFSRSRKQGELNTKYIFVVAYMLALFSGGLPPELVVVSLAKETFFSPYYRYMRRLRNLLSYRFKFSEAVNKVVKSVGFKNFSELLVRLSQAVSFGDDMVAFLSREVDFALSEYNSSMGRKLQSMNNFLSIYATLNSSLVFLVADVTIISLLYSGGGRLVELSAFMAGAVSGNLTLFMYMIYKPENYITYNLNERLVAVTAIVAAMTSSLLVSNYVAVASAGAVLMTLGLYYRVKENRINTLERYFLLFVRYFSRNYATVRNVEEALVSVLRGDLGTVRPLVKRAINRVRYGVNKERVFQSMSAETKSVLIYMLNRILYSTISLGGDVEIVGDTLTRVGDSLLNVRAQREQNGRAFESTIYALHSSTAGVSAALIAIVGILNSLFSISSVSSVFQFSPMNLGLVERLLLVILVMLSLSNGVAITLAYGRSLNVSLYFIGLLMIMSAITFHVVLLLTNGLFSSLYSPGGVVSPP